MKHRRGIRWGTSFLVVQVYHSSPDYGTGGEITCLIHRIAVMIVLKSHTFRTSAAPAYRRNRMNEHLMQIEQMRKSVMLRKLLLIFLPIAVLIGSFFFFRKREPMLIAVVPFIAIFLDALVYLIFVRKRMREYRDFYKRNYVNAMIRSVIPSAQYHPEQGFPSRMINQTGLIMMGNIYKSEDLIEGDHNNVHFRRADLLIEDEYRDSDGDTHTVTYFKGRWMIFESNKYFEADLQVIQKGFGHARRRTGIFTRKVDRRHAFETEDVTFNNQFKCLCQNESEAFYLLTPVLMQGLMRLAAESDGKVMVGFVDNLIHVAIQSSKDYLEPPVFHKVSDKEILDIQKEIHAVTSFVEGLRLDRKIFMQEKY